MLITSVDNERVKKYMKLQQRKYREEYQEFIVEGMHLVLEAFKKGMIVEIILEKDEVVPLNSEIVYVTREILEKISTVKTPQNIMALCKMPKEEIILGERILFVDEVQDPGNLGTIIRSSVAFGVDTIVLSSNTVDLYNPKTIRSTQGMNFYVNIITDADLVEVIEKIKEKDIPVYGTKVGYGEDVRSLAEKDKKRYALVVGNEGNGVREKVSEVCDKHLYIHLNDRVESLNVGIATSILLYELGR